MLVIVLRSSLNLTILRCINFTITDGSPAFQYNSANITQENTIIGGSPSTKQQYFLIFKKEI